MEKKTNELYQIYIFTDISYIAIFFTRCFHQWGGAKMMLREIHGFMQPGNFVYKTDVYSYYASMNHALLYRQLEAIDWTRTDGNCDGLLREDHS
jgi:hypothetical protein